MKQLKKLFFAFALCAPLTAAADVEINATNFPDENFRAYLLEQSYGADGVITDDEIKGITAVNLYGIGVSSLKGIEYFTALTDLNCYDNQLTTLDVSNNTALTFLNCGRNQLTTLDVSKNTALISLSCHYNQLTALDVSNNTALTSLSCVSNQLTALDVSSNKALDYLGCHYNQLTVLDVSNNTALTQLYCYSNQIKGEAMEALVNSLPTSANNSLYVYYEENDGNVITKSQVAAAKAKGWIPYYLPMNEWDWIEYEGMDDDAPASIALPELENGTAEIYNLAGQKVAAPMKGGVYVVGGKKVVVK